jgi:CheY-like chemotaxis protein
MNSEEQALILVVDDNEMNRDMLSRRLERQGYRAIVAEDGQQALEILPRHAFDLMLLDIMMPRMNGYEVLENVKNDPALRYIPVIMISAVDDLDSVVKCVEMGADDYLFKPFNPILLKARISASLEKKRLRDQEQVFLRQLQSGGQGGFAVVPPFVAERLKTGEQGHVVDTFDALTVLVAGVTGLGEFGTPEDMVNLLNQIVTEFDRLVDEYGAYRVRSTGSTYMLAGGPPIQPEGRENSIGAMALDMQRAVGGLRAATGQPVGLRIGIHTGAVVGGVIKTQNLTYYDLWGEAVTVACHLESAARSETIIVSEAAHGYLGDHYLYDSFVLGADEKPVYRLKDRR